MLFCNPIKMLSYVILLLYYPFMHSNLLHRTSFSHNISSLSLYILFIFLIIDHTSCLPDYQDPGFTTCTHCI